MKNTINFTSSYRFPMTQPGVNRFKRESLKPELMKYTDRIGAFQIPNTGKGHGRISVKENYDGFVEGIFGKVDHLIVDLVDFVICYAFAHFSLHSGKGRRKWRPPLRIDYQRSPLNCCTRSLFIDAASSVS